MKTKKSILITTLALAITAIVFYACEKEKIVSSPTSYDEANTIKSKTSEQISTSQSSNWLFQNHVTDMRKMSNTDLILVKFLTSIEWRNLPASLKRNANLTNVSLISYDYSENLKVIEIPLKNSKGESNIMVYTSISKESSGDNLKFLPVISEMTQLGDGIRQFKLLSIEGNVYYGLKLNADNKVGDFKILTDLPIREIITHEPNPVDPGGKPSCPESTSTFGDCMLCAIDECAHDWVCAVTCTVAAEACLVGFGLACATA